MNKNTMNGRWLEMKGEIQKAWGKLTDDELEKAKGDMKAIGGAIQRKYGENQEIYGKKLSDIFHRFETQKDKAVQSVKETLNK